jgi:hypothetical protein
MFSAVSRSSHPPVERNHGTRKLRLDTGQGEFDVDAEVKMRLARDDKILLVS